MAAGSAASTVITHKHVELVILLTAKIVAGVSAH